MTHERHQNSDNVSTNGITSDIQHARHLPHNHYVIPPKLHLPLHPSAMSTEIVKSIDGVLLTDNFKSHIVNVEVAEMDYSCFTPLNFKKFLPQSIIQYELLDYDTPVGKGLMDVYHDSRVTLEQGAEKKFLLVPQTQINEGKPIDEDTSLMLAQLIMA